MALYKTGLFFSLKDKNEACYRKKLPGDYCGPGEKQEHLYSNIYI